jgi:hypothetical protein
MFIILTKDSFYKYDLVINYCGRPKEFQSLDEAIQYVDEMELNPAQIIQVTI